MSLTVVIVDQGSAVESIRRSLDLLTPAMRSTGWFNRARSKPSEGGDVALVGLKEHTESLAASLAESGQTTRQHHVKVRIPALNNLLSAMAGITAIVDATGQLKSTRRRLAKNLPFHVVEGGRYVVTDIASGGTKRDDSGHDVSETLFEAWGASVGGGQGTSNVDVLGLAACLTSLEVAGPDLVATCRGRFLRKLRDDAATNLLNASSGASWGKEIAVSPAALFEVPAILATNRHEKRFPASFDVPALHTRVYRNAVCHFGQVVTRDRFILPDSFRRPTQHRLQNRQLTDRSPDFADVDFVVPTRTATRPLLYVDTEYPDHFGHVTTEVFGRLAAYRGLVEQEPELGILLSTTASGRFPSWLRSILEALEIPENRWEILRAGEAVRVPELWARTAEISQPYWISEGFGDFARDLRERLVGSPKPTGRVFSSRAQADVRSCNNTAEVEDLFRNAGFEILRPEKMSFVEQVRAYASSEAIAGFGGSNMFQMVFADGGDRIIVAGDSYTAINEYMLAAVTNSRIHYSFHDSDIQQPAGGWTWDAFFSNFTFDQANDPELGRLLKDISA